MSGPWFWLAVPWNLFRGALKRVGPWQRRTIVLLAGSGLVICAVRVVRLIILDRRLSRVVKAKRQAMLNDCALLGQTLVSKYAVGVRNRDSITRISLTALRDRLAEGQLSPTEVLSAYQSQALLSNMQCNCLTDILLTAESEAQRLTALSPVARQQLPLFGVPISLKEHFAIKGLDCTFGNPSYCDQPHDVESAVVQHLRNLGAVPFVRTNMAQLGLAIDCANALYGETANPHAVDRSPGGSSGGEAALVASFGSPLGIGSDVGGSIRIPAALCGVCGFKPTAERVSSLDCPPVIDAQSYIVPLSIGPIARDVDGLELGCRALFSEDITHLDPFCPPLPYRSLSDEHRRSFKVGFYITLKGPDAMRAVPAVQRGVMVAKEALEARGHLVVPWSPPHVEDLLGMCVGAYFSDGGVGVRKACAREQVTRDLALCSALFGFPPAVRMLLAFIIRPASLLLSRAMLATVGTGSVYRLWRFYETIGSYSGRFTSMWMKSGLDAVICPTLPFTAPPLGHSGFLASSFSYCAIYNILNFPAGVLPVTKVNEEDLARMDSEYPVDDLLLRGVRAGQRATLGLPVGVQCVSLKWQDERCLAVMKEIEAGVRMMSIPTPV